jgi:DNA-binding transcriptional ArsR family regulator
LLANEPAGVSKLVEQTGLSQPLVSQHLRTLRAGDLVTVTRSGRESVYEITDQHIVHVVEDAIVHVREDIR